MKSFLDHLKEEVLPTVQVTDGGLDISKPSVRAAINAAIAGVVSQPAVTPYVVFNRLSKLLAQYHIILPKRFLEGDKGVEVFELRQFGHKMGMTDSGEFVNEVPSTHYLFLQYGILSPFGITYAKPVVGGMFRVMARLVDKEELDKLMDMAEITMAEEAEVNQAIAKANAPRDPMHDVTSDEKKKGNKAAVATSEKKSLDEEDFNAGQALKNVRDADAAKNPNGPAAMRNKAEDEALERAGKGLARDMKEDKDPCWKGYEMIGMKKKGGRKVPNCVPVEEASDKDRDLSKLASAAISKGQSVKKLPAGRAQNAVLPKGMAKGANIEKGRWSGHGSFNEEQIDELKKSTLGSYIKKAHISGLEAASQGEIAYANKDKAGLRKANKTGEKREQGINLAATKLAREEYEKQEAGVKKRSDATHTLHRRNPGHKTEYHTITTERDGRKSVKTGSPKYIKKHWDKMEEEKGDKITSGTGIPNFTQKNLQDVAKDLGTGQGGATFAMKSNSGTPSRQVNVSSDPAERGNKFTNRAPINEKAPPGAKFERMVKHIKKRYAKDGLTAKEKGIAFATAWKAKNREKGE